MKPDTKHNGYVLIIDDDKDICELLSFLLEHAGYETRQGYDGATAMELLSQREPDVLLLDTIIPEPNGMVVLAHAHSLFPQYAFDIAGQVAFFASHVISPRLR
ncbi:MAG: response regulator [Candidatus Methylumidiphilus sp.]